MLFGLQYCLFRVPEDGYFSAALLFINFQR